MSGPPSRIDRRTGAARAIDDALFVISSTPTGPVAGVVVRPGSARAVVGETIAFRVGGVDTALNGVSLAGAPVTWSMSGGAGSLGGDGRLPGVEPGQTRPSRRRSVRFAATAAVTSVPDTYRPAVVAPEHARAAWCDGRDRIRARDGQLARRDGYRDGGRALRPPTTARRRGAWTDVALPRPTTTRRVGGRADRAGRSNTRSGRRTEPATTSAWRTGSTFHLRLASERPSAVDYAGHGPSHRSRRRTSAAPSSRRARRGKTATLHIHRQPGGVDRGARTDPRLGSRLRRRRIRGDQSASERDDAPAAGRVQLRVVERRPAPDHDPRVGDGGTLARGRRRVRGGRLGQRVSGPRRGRRHRVVQQLGEIRRPAGLSTGSPGTVFAAGDIAYPSGTAAQFAKCYSPTWGRFKWRTRPVPGNHDYQTAGAAPVLRVLRGAGGHARPGLVRLRRRDVARLQPELELLARSAAAEPGSPQETWLRADLAANPRTCVAAVWHHPLFSSGSMGRRRRRDRSGTPCTTAGADIVINGHDHDYERFAPQRPDGSADAAGGIREFVVGTGGGASTRSRRSCRTPRSARRACSGSSSSS